MPGRRSTTGDPPTDEVPIPASAPTTPTPTDALGGWITEVTVGMERMVARQEAVEKSVDGLSKEVRAAEATAARAATVLERIAKAEEDRFLFMREEAERAAAAADRAAKAEEKNAARTLTAREEWRKRVWESPAFQLLIIGFVVSALNLLGVGYLAHSFGTSGGSAPAPAPVSVPP
jgi:hypothetical protein